MNKFLNDSEIGLLLTNWNESDDGFECSDDEDQLFMYTIETHNNVDRDIDTTLDIKLIISKKEDYANFQTVKAAQILNAVNVKSIYV